MFMFQFGDGTGLTLKTYCGLLAFWRIGNGSQVATYNLNCYFTSDTCMLSQVNVAHTTALDESYQPISPKRFPHQYIHLAILTKNNIEVKSIRICLTMSKAHISVDNRLLCLYSVYKRRRKESGVDKKNVLYTSKYLVAQ